MAKVSVLAGATSVTVNVFIQDSSSTTGAGLSGLVFNTSGLLAYYVLPAAAATAITLATQTVTGAFSSGGFVEIDATHTKGLYRLDIPNAAIASGRFSTIYLYGATNMAPCVLEIELTAWNNQDGVHGGLTCLPNTAVTTNGSLITSGTGTAQLEVTSGLASANAKQINAVSTSSVTTISANQGTTQPLNFTGTAGSALVKSDMVDVAGSAVSAMTAQLGVNVVNWNNTVVATPATAGIPDVNVKNINNTAAATPGASGGVLISGSNSGTTTLAALTVTGATTHTGNVSMAAGLTITQSSSNASAVAITGNGTGHGIISTSGSGATGDGIKAVSTATAGNGMTLTHAGSGSDFNATTTPLTLAKTTNITGFNDIAATAIVSAGAITTSSGAVSTVTTVTTATNLTNAPTSGDFTSTMKTSLNNSTPASITGAVSSVTGNVGGNVVGSVASVTARVTANTDQLAGQTVTAAAGVTFPSSVSSPTNITAGTITTVTNLTNAPTAGDFTATMKTSLNAATPSVTVSDKTGFSLSSAGNNSVATAVLTNTMTESYPTVSAAFTLAQGIYNINQQMGQMAISGTTMTTKKRDQSTTAKTFTLDSSTSPTQISETT